MPRVTLLRPYAVRRYAAGEGVSRPQAGDFILTRDDYWFSRLVRVGQGLRFRGPERVYARWNHAAVVEDESGNLIEANDQGIVRTHLEWYRDVEYYYVRIEASAADRAQVTDFARWALGQRYGYLTLLSIAVALLTGGKLVLGLQGQYICSGLVARCLERAGYIFDKVPSEVMPADLARYFGVRGS
jgi:hypothetical protein